LVCKRRDGIDLHIHSNASDGTLSPAEIIRTAKHLNLAAIAITDHDSVEGCRHALELGLPDALKFMTGVEISSSPPPAFGSGSLHILGYSIDIDNPDLNSELHKLRSARESRNPKIIEKLNSLGIDLHLDDVGKFSDDKAQMSRPHIALAMVKKGYTGSVDEAFEKYLGKEKPAYVDKYRVDHARAIELILEAGGIPVLAHPCLLRHNRGDIFENFIGTLKNIGLMGIEVYYPEHSDERTRYYADIAKRFGLLKTGGTDFHGAIKPEIKMGTGSGDLFISYEIYETLAANR